MRDSIYLLIILGSGGGILLAGSVIFFFVRYQRRFIRQQAALQQAELDHRQTLLNAVIHSQEDERMRISKDLHDHIGSALSNLRLTAGSMAQHSEEPEIVKTLAGNYKAGIDNVMQDVRNISHNLSPAGLELWGFYDALDEYFHKVGPPAGLQITLSDHTGNSLRRLAFDDALALFRVIQELLANTIKHARAQRVTIDVRNAGDSVQIVYTDDGRGIATDSGKPGIGLYNIESRLSTLGAGQQLASAPGKGYIFTILLPLERLKQNADGEN